MLSTSRTRDSTRGMIGASRHSRCFAVVAVVREDVAREVVRPVAPDQQLASKGSKNSVG